MSEMPEIAGDVEQPPDQASEQQPPAQEIKAIALPSERPDLYRASMYAELQKFPNRKHARQLLLSEATLTENEVENELDRLGLVDDVGQIKALAAIQKLLDRTHYQGNRPPGYFYSQTRDATLPLPRLNFTTTEYLEAYGVRPGKDGRFPRQLRDEALKALKELTAPRRAVYKRARWQRDRRGRSRKVYDVIVTYAPLITIRFGYLGVSEKDTRKIEQGQDSPDRVNRIEIEAGPLLMEGLHNNENFYLLKQAAAYRELEETYTQKRGGRKKRIGRAMYLFLDWLQTKNHRRVRVTRDTLIERLRLDGYLRQRKGKLAWKQIDDCLEVARELGYLAGYQEDGFGLITLELNPEKCRRVGSPDGETDDQDDS